MNELSVLISIAMGVCLIFVLYNNYRLDHFRQDLFAIRDELFDEARAGRISFASPAYRTTRILINGLLRFGHEISLLNFFITRLMVGKAKLSESSRQFHQAFTTGAADSDEELCMRFLARVHARTVAHVFRSPIAVVTLVVPMVALTAALIGRDLAMFTARKLKGQLAELDACAFERGGDRQTSIGSQSFC